MCQRACTLSPAIRIAGTEHSGPARRLCRAVHQPLVRADAGQGRRPRGGVEAHRVLAALGSNVEIDGRRRITTWCWRSPATFRIWLPTTSWARWPISRRHTQSEVIKFSASGFRDFTRIAASDPVMWRDVFLTNRDAVLEMLGRFLEDLSKLQRMVRVGDGPALEALFTRTRKIRRSIITAGQETAAPDFGRPHGEAKTHRGSVRDGGARMARRRRWSRSMSTPSTRCASMAAATTPRAALRLRRVSAPT